MNFNLSLPPPPPSARAANQSLGAARGTAAPFFSSAGSAKQHPPLHLHPCPTLVGCLTPCQWAANGLHSKHRVKFHWGSQLCFQGGHFPLKKLELIHGISSII